jgi:hypothetical protein
MDKFSLDDMEENVPIRYQRTVMHPHSDKGILDKKHGIFNLTVHLQNLDTVAHYGDHENSTYENMYLRIPLNEKNCFEVYWFKNMKQRSQFCDGGGDRFSSEKGKLLADYMTSHSEYNNTDIDHCESIHFEELSAYLGTYEFLKKDSAT